MPTRRVVAPISISHGREKCGNLEILVAGCGTSQAARYALREPALQIVAIDISETSLAIPAISSENTI